MNTAYIQCSGHSLVVFTLHIIILSYIASGKACQERYCRTAAARLRFTHIFTYIKKKLGVGPTTSIEVIASRRRLQQTTKLFMIRRTYMCP